MSTTRSRGAAPPTDVDAALKAAFAGVGLSPIVTPTYVQQPEAAEACVERTPDPSAPSEFIDPPKPQGSGFVQPPWWDLLTFSMTRVRQRGACLFGPRGSGKTSAVHELSKATGEKLVTYQAAAGCTLDDLVGVRDLRDGRTVFTDGPLPEALRDDCWLLIEEANVMHPGVFSKLNTLTDGSGDKLRLPDGTSLAVGPKFRVVLAFNEGASYSGTREVNAALRDRLMPIYADYLPMDLESKIIQERTGVDQASADALVAVAAKIRAGRAALGFDLSPRALFRMLELMRYCRKNWKEAFGIAILDLVGDPIDRKPQRDSIEQIASLDGLYAWSAPSFSDASAAVRSTHAVGAVETADDFAGDWRDRCVIRQCVGVAAPRCEIVSPNDYFLDADGKTWVKINPPFRGFHDKPNDNGEFATLSKAKDALNAAPPYPGAQLP